ncbi:hypothetical protein NPM18_23005, partial [Bacillus cereus]|nr:hypothetical protein [Bacillus cereus]MCQ6318211.1 hypothetical protein [Bacillus cereus]MCQ6329878.1 hypothetical protein [Bacillus cereus]MCQ6385939.1 hypothetical protein [Bacillus cereus]
MHVDMWIPYGEVKTYFARKKGKWYRKLENEFEDRRKEEEQKMMVTTQPPFGVFFNFTSFICLPFVNTE